MDENEIDQTEHVEIDVSGDLLHCTVGLYEFFMAHGKEGAAAFRVYFHLLYTYRRQKDIIRGTQILATTDYIAKGLGMGYSTVTAAKKFLESHGLIKLITKRDKNNRITGHYIRLILTSEPSRLLKENMETDYIAQNHIPESQGVETSNQIREVENLNTGGRNTGEEIDVLPALSVPPTDPPPDKPFTQEEAEQIYLSNRTKGYPFKVSQNDLWNLSQYSKQYGGRVVRGWFERYSKERPDKDLKFFWDYAQDESKKTVKEKKAITYCEHCGKPMPSGICKNKDCPQYIGLEDIHLHLQKQGYDDTSPPARMVEALVGAAV